MAATDLQSYASIISDLTTLTLVVLALVWVEKRRIELASKIMDDWDDLRRARNENLPKGEK